MLSPLVVEQDGLLGWAIKGNPPVRGVTPPEGAAAGPSAEAAFWR